MTSSLSFQINVNMLSCLICRLPQLWLVLGVFLMATTLRMYAACQQLQTQAQIHAAAANSLIGHTDLRHHVPPTIALSNRGHLQGLRLQLALLDREFDDLGAVITFVPLIFRQLVQIRANFGLYRSGNWTKTPSFLLYLLQKMDSQFCLLSSS